MPKNFSNQANKATDKHVGSRVRMRRLMINMTQEGLAHELGLTFQQVQKYEKGANRVSASKLVQMAQIMKTSIDFFFEGLPHWDGSTQTVGHDLTTNFFKLQHTTELANLYIAMDNAARLAVLEVARSLVRAADSSVLRAAE